MMKRLKIIFAILITSSTLFAAVDMNSREMKNLVKAVEKLRESKSDTKLKFTGAESTAKAKLKAAKIKNSGPEIDRLAAEIAEISTKYWGGVNADLDAQREAGKTDHDFTVLMREIARWPQNYWIDCKTEDGRAKAKASRADFSARVDKALEDRFKAYLAGKAGRGGASFGNDINREISVIEKDLKPMKSGVLSSHGPTGYSNYNKILAWQAYLTGLARLFPNEPKYLNLLNKINAELASLGSESTFEERWRQNAKAQTAKVRMPAARSNDAAVISEVRNAFNNSGNTAEILKINLTTTQWTIIRNQLTSIIEGRTQEAAIATKQANGECLLYNVTIYQQYDGSNYGPARMYGFSNVEMVCSNAK